MKTYPFWLINLGSLIIGATAAAQSVNVTSVGTGIGTLAPRYSLEIQKDVVSNLGPTLVLTNAAGGADSGAAFGFGSFQSQPISAQIRSLDDGNYSMHLAFQIKAPGNQGNALTERMRITSLGNVGLGESSPRYQLEIRKDSSNGLGPTVSLYNASGGMGSGGAVAFTTGQAQPITAQLQSLDDGTYSSHLSFQTKVSGAAANPLVERLRITAGGDIGIGVIAPQGRLSLNSPYDNNDTLNFFSWANNSFSIQTLLDARTLAGYGTYGGGENKLSLQPLVGNVGIGTLNPTHTLTVNGVVKARGYITDTSAWSDYVFSPDYKLPSLSEVEAHINENKHLPGIPSEKEVLSNGVNIGEMQAKLLAQIEQLTLHLIAQEKRIQILEKENASFGN